MQLKENDMFLEKPKVDMETAYGLHYPGEMGIYGRIFKK